MPPIILASGSPYRSLILKKLGLPFTVSVADINESALPDESPLALATRLAEEKSIAVADQLSDGLVIGSDQVAVLDGEQLGKPGLVDTAVKQLMMMSGKTVEFHTGICVSNAATRLRGTDVDTCRVTFRRLSRDQAERYVSIDNPLDCAGSFKSEGFGITLIERIDGSDPNALVGLPLIRLIRLLDSFGVRLP